MIKKKNYYALLILLIIVGCNPLKQADRKAKKNTITVYFPDLAFDINEAKAATNEGNSTIRGILFTKVKTFGLYKAPLTPKTYGTYQTVTLYPATAYFEDWYRLRKEKENKRTRIYMSEQALFYRIITTTDGYGRFQFDKMKPGRYFLQAYLNINIAHNRNVAIGSGTTEYGGTVTYYENERYYSQQGERIEKFVEINRDGEVVEIKLKK
jgi:hypothetical protein